MTGTGAVPGAVDTHDAHGAREARFMVSSEGDLAPQTPGHDESTIATSRGVSRLDPGLSGEAEGCV